MNTIIMKLISKQHRILETMTYISVVYSILSVLTRRANFLLTGSLKEFLGP